MSNQMNIKPSVTHELLSPLNVILGLTQILRIDTTLSSQHKEMIDSIQGAGENLLSQIHEIFDIPENYTVNDLANKTIARKRFNLPVQILVVDDVNVNRFMIKQMLLQYPDIIIEEAADAQSAIDQINEKKPQIVLMDIHMPDMNGFDIIQQIREDEDFIDDDIIFVMMSSDSKYSHEEQIIAFNIDAYLPKPIRMNNLVALIKRYVPELTIKEDEKIIEVASKPENLPDENFLQEVIRLARQGAYSEIKNLMEQLKTRQTEFFAFIRYLEQLLKNFQFKEIIDWINSSLSKNN
jgi:CheY-like chemotaxis protein